MALELSQEFVFDADAATICEYITSLPPHPKCDHKRPAITVTDENFTCICEFLIGSRPDALYSFELSVSVWRGKPDDDITSIWDNRLTLDNECLAEIALTQERAGECKAGLYLSHDPKTWVRNSKSNASRGIFTRLIVDTWRALVNGWLSATPDAATVPASGAALGDRQNTTPLDQTKLHETIDQHFDSEDLRTLCFKLGIDYDNLSGDKKSGKVRELILYCEKCDCFGELIELLRKERPNVSW